MAEKDWSWCHIQLVTSTRSGSQPNTAHVSAEWSDSGLSAINLDFDEAVEYITMSPEQATALGGALKRIVREATGDGGEG